ncbi:hypothetical protein ACFE04_010863 [Oxalis oulophora]
MFNGDPRTSAATPDQLSLISIEFMYGLAYNTVNTYINVINNVPEGQLRIAARNCLNNYDAITRKSGEAYRLSAMHMYTRINQFTESERLAYKCGAQTPIKSSIFLQIVNVGIIFRCQIAKSVITYLKES